MRCGSCNKFVSFDSNTEPETEDFKVDDDGNVTGTVRIVNTCADCGEELKEASLDVEEEPLPDVKSHLDEEKEHELELEVDSSERTERSEGKGRGTRTFYGASVSYTVTCSCDADFQASGETTVEIQASSMEENS